MKIYLNNVKAVDVKKGTLIRPLIGINIDTENRKLQVSGIYHRRFVVHNDGSIITIVFGWNAPKYAIFLTSRFPFIVFYKADKDIDYLKEEE